MGPVAKLAAVGIGGGALAVGGTYLWKHMSDVMPPWHSLADDKNYSTKSGDNGDYNGKYGASYSNYLVGIEEASSNKEPKDNDPWWNWIYLNIFSKVTSHQGKFSKVKQAIGGDDENVTLKGVCTQAYKDKKNGGDGKIKDAGSITDTDFQEEDIWKFCSPIGQKPTTLDKDKNSVEKAKYANKLGQDTTGVTKFISIDDPGNAIFWDIRQKEFFTTDSKFSPKTVANETFFKSFYDTENTKPKEQRRTIKERCKEAYLTNKVVAASETQQTTTTPTSAEITKYCSLDGSS